MPTPDPKQANPGFRTLLWDSAKTTGYYGGSVPMGAALTLPFWFLALFVCQDITNPKKSYKAGTYVGTATLAPVSAFLFSVPFAIAAQFTRKFLPYQAIEMFLDTFNSITNEQTQETIINTILETDKRDWVRSYSSANLKSTLSDQTISTAEKWTALKNYLEERSGKAYVNNGKKLFNAALDAVGVAVNGATPITRNSSFASDTGSQLFRLYAILINPKWEQEGVGFFGKKCPKSILQLRKCMEDPRDPSQANVIIIRQLKNIVDERGENSYRSEKTKALHKIIRNLGKEGNLEALNQLEQSLTMSSAPPPSYNDVTSAEL